MIDYRSDIQVIRGICLISIFIYHYNKNYLNSGFIGVDIFFLLSSYVNTYSFLKKKNITFIKYYFHRGIRIIPVSYIVLLISLYISSHENIIYQKKLYLDILSADLSVSNYRFIFLSTDYLSKSEKSSIVLHYWSLSIEDQFYFIFPFFIRTITSNIICYTLLLIITYIYSVYECIYYHSYSYFSFFSRLWEFLYGILLLKINRFKQINCVSNIILLMIISILFMNNIEKISPSFSIIPLSLVILVLNYEKNKYILSSQVLQHLGNISYCFYLFHYVIIYLITEYSTKYNKIFICFISTYLISFLFTKFYENPIRKNIEILNYQIIIIVLLHLSLLASIFYLLKVNKSKISNVKVIENNILKIKNQKLLYSYNDVIIGWNELWSNAKQCPSKIKILERYKEGNIALLMSDSHGEQWFKIIIPYLISNNYIPLQLYVREYNVIVKDLSSIRKIINNFKYVHIIIVANYLKNDIIEPKLSYFKNYINLLLNHTNSLYIIQDTPHFTINPSECINAKKNYYECYGIIGINATIEKFPLIIDKRIKYIDMNEYICDNLKYCSFVIDNYPVYKDDNHLSIQFATKFKKEFLEQFKVNKIENNLKYNKVWYKCVTVDNKFKQDFK